MSKIFDERGFLTQEGQTLVQQRFIPEVKNIIKTATDYNDVQIISGILKSLVDDYSSKCRLT